MSARTAMMGLVLSAAASNAFAVAVSDPQTFTVAYNPSIFAAFAGEITAVARLSISDGKVGVTIDPKLKIIHKRDPGGLAIVAWEIDCSNAESSFTEVRVFFSGGTVTFKAGQAAPIPPFGSGIYGVEVDYDWQGNKKTLNFTNFRLEGNDANFTVPSPGVMKLNTSLLPKPTESASELAKKRDEEAAKARAAAREKLEEVERRTMKMDEIYNRGGVEYRIATMLRKAAEKETDAAKKNELLNEAKKREAAGAALYKEGQAIWKEASKVREEARKLLTAADRLTREAEDLRKVASTDAR